MQNGNESNCTRQVGGGAHDDRFSKTQLISKNYYLNLIYNNYLNSQVPLLALSTQSTRENTYCVLHSFAKKSNFLITYIFRILRRQSGGLLALANFLIDLMRGAPSPSKKKAQSPLLRAMQAASLTRSLCRGYYRRHEHRDMQLGYC